jgi:hypothetical protein
VRQLGSKLLAGGLSAGVVLLWWPLFFPTQSVTTWLGRGIVWTLAFELLLVALTPFELALWSTGRGERISRRFEAKRALLDHHSPKRRMGRRAALAVLALTLPFALIGLGVARHIPASGQPVPAARVMRVTRVVRVVKPVRVERVVKIRTVSEQVPVASPTYPSPAAEVHTITKHQSASTKHVAMNKPAAAPVTPNADTGAPSTTPSTPTDSSSGSSTPATTPLTDTSGAAAQPTS